MRALDVIAFWSGCFFLFWRSIVPDCVWEAVAGCTRFNARNIGAAEFYRWTPYFYVV